MDVEYSFLFCCCCKYCTYARGMWIICLIRYTWKLWPACTLRNCIKKKLIHSQLMQIPWNKKMQVFSINNDWKHSFIFFQQCSINAVQMKALSWGGVRDTIYCTVLCNCWTLSRIDYDRGMMYAVWNSSGYTNQWIFSWIYDLCLTSVPKISEPPHPPPPKKKELSNLL